MTALIDWIRYLMGLAQPEKLHSLVSMAGPWWVGYLILFGIIFSETGLLVGFFLPGDSLLFAAGLLASQDVFNIGLLMTTLSVAAIVGDAVNYYLGRQMGEKVFDRGHLRFVKHSHLMAAKAFYDHHGGKAIILARFVPLVRTFTPFVAGVARMSYSQFVVFNIVGGIGWVVSMSLAGYFLGRIPWVSANFEKVVIGIVLLSVVPIVIGMTKHWLAGRRQKAIDRELVAAETSDSPGKP